MQLRLQNFSTLVAGAAAAVQGSARQLVDLTVGSTLRAVLEANASVALWLQWLILQVQKMTRAATSDGLDLDSWIADFGLARLPASPAVGAVRFSRFTPTEVALVPSGALVRTGDAAQGFRVQADTTHAAWSAAQNGYVLGAGVAGVVVSVAAELAGSAGNVQPGAVRLIAEALAGVDSVANDAALFGGLDAESDTDLRVRFRDYLASRSRATRVAVGFAVASLRQGLRYTITENAIAGSFVVTLDDGSGAPSADLLSSAATAIEAVRPLATSFAVQPPVVSMANVTMTITTAAEAVHVVVAATVATAIAAYLNGLAIGAAVAWSRLAQVAYDASPGVANVSAVLLNGGAADLVPGASGVVKPGIVVVS